VHAAAGRVNYDVYLCSLTGYVQPMPKTDPIGVRLDPEERAALERAAAADDRPVSALCRKIVAEWLRKNGWLKSSKLSGKAAKQ
jgi:hypothetical protein